jgi:uncharacterized protein YndB with AHSA1/START domain
MNKSIFLYVTYIRTSPEKLWSALTTEEFTRQYWLGARCVSDWKPGSSWKLMFDDGRLADSGEIVECLPPKRLAIKWRNEWSEEIKAEGYSLCTFDIETMPDVSPQSVKLTVTHSIERAESRFIGAVSSGWPIILSNLKSLLETGTVIKASKAKPA